MKLGNDIIEIDRIRQALEKSQSFRDRVYTPHGNASWIVARYRNWS